MQTPGRTHEAMPVANTRPLAVCVAVHCLPVVVQVNAEVRFLLARLNFSDFYTRSPKAGTEVQ